MELEYRGQTYKNFIVSYEDSEPIKIELFKKGSHYSSENRESIHTSPEKVKVKFTKNNQEVTPWKK